MCKDTAEKELIILRKIRDLYQEIASVQNADYYFLKEQELEDLFASVSSLGCQGLQTDERRLLLENIYSLNMEIVQLVETAKGKMLKSEQAMKSYYPSFSPMTSAFFDKKG